MDITDIVERYRSSVLRLGLYRGSDQIGSGSAFMAHGRVITNSHVIRQGQFDAVEITFGDQDTNPVSPIRLSQDDFLGRIRDESQEGSADFVVLDLSAEPEFAPRSDLPLSISDDSVKVGDQVVLLGFPFMTNYLTSHVGHVSASYSAEAIHKLQIDAKYKQIDSLGLPR